MFFKEQKMHCPRKGSMHLYFQDFIFIITAGYCFWEILIHLTNVIAWAIRHHHVSEDLQAHSHVPAIYEPLNMDCIYKLHSISEHLSEQYSFPKTPIFIFLLSQHFYDNKLFRTLKSIYLCRLKLLIFNILQNKIFN